jgi:hypothetical protein
MAAVNPNDCRQNRVNSITFSAYFFLIHTIEQPRQCSSIGTIAGLEDSAVWHKWCLSMVEQGESKSVHDVQFDFLYR